ncbi:hypothetical protein QUC31_013313 [Theobroma cacao]
MDEYKQKMKLQAVGKLYHRDHFLKRTLQLVVSVALLSFFLCHSSGFFVFPHSFSVYFSTFLFSFFTHTLERKYMFLICNGILAFLAKSSVPSSSSPSESDLGAQISTSSTNLTQTNEVVPRYSDDGDNDVPLVAEREEAEDAYENEVEEQGEQDNIEPLGRVEGKEDDEERESEVSVIVEDGEYKEGESGLVMQEDQHKEEGAGAPLAANEDVPSTEDLNQKFEEFIRKMKEEIRIEAQQQLIAV